VEVEHHCLAHLRGPDGFEQHLAVDGTAKERVPVAEQNRNNEQEHLLNKLGFEALLDQVWAHNERVLFASGLQCGGNRQPASAMSPDRKISPAWAGSLGGRWVRTNSGPDQRTH
jgi:hypothetical protein